MVKGIIIPNLEDLKEKKKKILEGRAEKFHVLADFDLTLTKAFVDGQKSHTVMAQLRSGNYLSEEYSKKAHELFDKYHPIEINPNISEEEKFKKMKEWWVTHFKILVESGLNKKVIEQVVKDKPLKFREGTKNLLKFLNEKNISLIIISSSGLGDAIPMYFKKENLLYKNIHIISNLFKYNESGKVVGIKEPVIHIMNKSEISVKELPIYNELKKRKNVLLLGDGIGDVGMIEGFDYNNLIKIGFLNHNVKESLEKFKQNFDIVLTNDANMNYVNKLLKEIIK